MREDAAWRIGALVAVALVLTMVFTLATDKALGSSPSLAPGSLSTPSMNGGSSSGASPGTGLNNTQQVLAEESAFLNDLSHRNTSALGQYYTPESVVVLKGCTDGLGGRYQGSSNIEGLYAEYENGIESFSFNSSHVTVEITGESSVNATYSLSMSAAGFFGTISASASVEQQWIHAANETQSAGGGWTISRETWNFVTLTVDSPLIHVPDCAS